MIRSLKIGARLTIGFAAILFVFILFSLYSIDRLNYAVNQTKDLYEHPFEVKSRLLSIKANTYKIRMIIRRAFTHSNKDEFKISKLQIKSIESDIMNDLKVVEDLYLGDKQLIKHISSHYEDYISLHDAYYALLSQGKKVEASRLLEGKMSENTGLTEALLKEASDFASNKALSFYETAMKSNEKFRQILYITLGMAILVSVMLSFVLARLITVPIKRLLEATKEVCSGNFDITLPITTKDEIGELSKIFQHMVKKIHRNILDLRLHSEIIANMAEGVTLVSASDWTFLYCNPKFEQMFAYDVGELIGKNVSVVNAPTNKSPEETARRLYQ